MRPDSKPRALRAAPHRSEPAPLSQSRAAVRARRGAQRAREGLLGIIGRHFSVFYPPEDVAAGKPQRELAIAASDGRLEDEGWRVRRDGTRFWANVVITALRDPTGLLLGYGKVTRDLTERHAHEQAVDDREQLVSGVLSAATECSIIASDLDGGHHDL
jgi:PAS domain-containing protein